MNTERLTFLDGLRGLAAMSVVLQHIGEILSPSFKQFTTDYFQLGQFGVMVFFLSSGFIIPASLERHASLRTFWIARVFRLYPLYWLSLAGALLLGGLGAFWLPPIFASSPWLAVAANITMLQTFMGVTSAIGLYWTLSFELVFYFAISFLFWIGVVRRSGIIAFAVLALAVLSAAIMPLALGRSGPIGGFNIATMFVGMVIYRHFTGGTDRRPWAR